MAHLSAALCTMSRHKTRRDVLRWLEGLSEVPPAGTPWRSIPSCWDDFTQQGIHWIWAGGELAGGSCSQLKWLVTPIGCIQTGDARVLCRCVLNELLNEAGIRRMMWQPNWYFFFHGDTLLHNKNHCHSIFNRFLLLKGNVTSWCEVVSWWKVSEILPLIAFVCLFYSWVLKPAGRIPWYFLTICVFFLFFFVR